MGSPSGGTVRKVSPVGVGDSYLPKLWGHWNEDVLPYIWCCKGSNSKCSYYYEHRPSDNGSNYQPPVPGMYVLLVITAN